MLSVNVYWAVWGVAGEDDQESLDEFLVFATQMPIAPYPGLRLTLPCGKAEPDCISIESVECDLRDGAILCYLEDEFLPAYLFQEAIDRLVVSGWKIVE